MVGKEYLVVQGRQKVTIGTMLANITLWSKVDEGYLVAQGRKMLPIGPRY